MIEKGRGASGGVSISKNIKKERNTSTGDGSRGG